jgi:DNA (cytosine-5)-methyltransferase 1
VTGLVVDLFAGGGGASVGIEAALGRSVDIAINHDAIALAVHKANHPATRHLEADIWEVRPQEATGGQPVDLLWASPDCTHFSVAKGDVPRRQDIRSLAWAVVRWAAAVKPRVICLENVTEFQSWGPLGPDGRPVKRRMGTTFLKWRGKLMKLGYQVDFRVLDASMYGAPTRRRRLFIVARCDGQAIRWPEPTHGPGREPLRTAAECIDWSLPCPSIFERKRPLAEKTLWRIAQGIRRFVMESPAPFIVQMSHGQWAKDGTPRRGRPGHPIEEPLGTVTGSNDFGIVTPSLMVYRHDSTGSPADGPLPTVTAGGNNRERPAGAGHALGLLSPTLIQTGYGERDGQAARVPGLHKPLGTMVNGQKHALVAAFLAKHYGGVVGTELHQPISTITAVDHHSLAAASLVQFNHENAPLDPCAPLTTVTSANHVAEVRAFLTAFYGSDGSSGKGQSMDQPARTLTARHRLGLVTVSGVDYQIVDIGMRMLEPNELLRAQFGRFAEAYDLSAATTKSAQVRLIGNSVCPEVAAALVAVNAPMREERAA